MSTYLFTFREPADYAPSAGTFDAWATWQRKLGARLKDRGNPGFAAAALGASVAGTTLGGYSLIRAVELASHDDRFDNWLDAIGDRS